MHAYNLIHQLSLNMSYGMAITKLRGTSYTYFCPLFHIYCVKG